MPLSSRGHRRACDQGPVVKKRDPLVCDRDDDLERALRSVLGSSVLRRFRVSLPVVVLVFERSVMAWPERVLGPKQKLSVCDPCREHENGEYCHCYRANRSDVDASGERCRHGALTTLFRRFLRAAHCWKFLCGHRPVSIGAIPSFRDDAGEATPRAFPDKIDHILSWSGMQRTLIGRSWSETKRWPRINYRRCTPLASENMRQSCEAWT